MDYIFENWFIIVAIGALVGVALYAVKMFLQLPAGERFERARKWLRKKLFPKVLEWLLLKVTEAEAALGSNTGKLKLRMVYDEFIGKFTWLAKVISFDLFSRLVDDALEEMREMIANNKNVAAFVNGEANVIVSPLDAEAIYNAVVEQNKKVVLKTGKSELQTN